MPEKGKPRPYKPKPWNWTHEEKGLITKAARARQMSLNAWMESIGTPAAREALLRAAQSVVDDHEEKKE